MISRGFYFLSKVSQTAGGPYYPACATTGLGFKCVWAGFQRSSAWRVTHLPQNRGVATESRQLKKIVLYKGKGIRIFRVLVRLKVFQLGGVAACAVPLGTFLTDGDVSVMSLGVAGGLLVGCAISAAALNFYSRRYLGELSLLTTASGEASVCFSVMDFWGNRVDNLVKLSEVLPPLKGVSSDALKQLALQPLIPIQVVGDRQFYISLRHGHLVSKSELMALLRGDHTLQLGLSC